MTNPLQDNEYVHFIVGNNNNASTPSVLRTDESTLAKNGQMSPRPQGQHSPQNVIAGIENLVRSIFESLTKGEIPTLSNDVLLKRFTLSQARSFTSIVMVYSFVHALLRSNRTTTTREVYYFYVTHFSNQRECDAAILDAASLLGVPRISMGLYASPKGNKQTTKQVDILIYCTFVCGGESNLTNNVSFNYSTILGWYCGSIEIIQNGTITDATTLSSVQGLPITREWIDVSECGNSNNEDEFVIRSNARCILVIEKEGVYIRLSEDRFFERIPCILVTGKGFPDLATRALVHGLATRLRIPVCGLCDCNPFGLGVLHTYERGSVRMGVDGGDRYGVPIRWVGLQPSCVQALQLPKRVYQRLTDVDRRRLDKLSAECHPFHYNHMDGNVRIDELRLMQSTGYKVELEALNWLGVDYMTDWIETILVHQDNSLRKGY